LKQGICIWQHRSMVSTVDDVKLITLQVVICLVLLSVSSLKLSPVWWWKESSSCWMLLLPWQLWI